MSIFDRLRSLFAKSQPVQPPIPVPQPKLKPRAESLDRLMEALGQVGDDRVPLVPLDWNKAHRHSVPKPYPGVVPTSEEKSSTLAMDSWSGNLAQFGESFAPWDGFSFMGYALLSELAQIPEFRRPSEILANDMTRKWVKIVSVSNSDKTELIKDLEDEIKAFKVQEVFRRAFELDNFFGIGHLFIDLGRQDGEELKTPLLQDIKIAKGSLKALRLVEPVWTYPVRYNAINPLSPDFYRPETWFVMGTEVHATRLLTFCSRPVPDILKPAYQFGGVALTQLLKPYVENWLRTRQSISDITHNFSTPVLMVDMDQMTTKEGAANLALRAQVYNTMRDNQGLLVCSKDKEDFKVVAAPLSSLDALQSQAEEQMAFPAGIPLVKLFGITPSGLNASSDGEVRVYYDSCESAQERIGTPNLKRVLDILQMNRFGKIDPDIGFVWQPLWSMTDKEKAEIEKLHADTDAVHVEMGSLDTLEVRKTIAAEEDSRYSSIDVDDVSEQPGEEDQETPDLGSLVGQMGAKRDEDGNRAPDQGREDRDNDPRGNRDRASLLKPTQGRALRRAEAGARE